MTDRSVISLSSGVVVVSCWSVQTGLILLGWNGFSLGLTKRFRGRKEVRLAGLLLGSTLNRATQNVRSWSDAGILDQISLCMMLDRADCWPQTAPCQPTALQLCEVQGVALLQRQGEGPRHLDLVKGTVRVIRSQRLTLLTELRLLNAMSANIVDSSRSL